MGMVAHLKTCIKFIGDKTTMVRVELAVVDHLSPDVIFPQVISLFKNPSGALYVSMCSY